MDALKHFFSKPRNVTIVLIVTFAVLIIALGLAVAALLSSDETQSGQSSTVSQAQHGGSSIGKGTVSSLSGGTSSYRNLKGITLRINQIDTCNPAQLSAYVSVSAQEGDVNKNFRKSDVRVYLDGKQITSFEFSSVDTTKLPLASMLVIDHSGSMAGAAITNAKSAATNYVDQLKPADQVGLIQFDDKIDILSAVTTDKAKVKNAIAGIAARGDTALYDALAQSIENVPNCGRKAVTVLTDGDDTASKVANQQSVIDMASKSNLPIFAVGIKSDGFDASSITAISEKTGGQYLEANTPAEITDLYKKIDGQLAGQFAANFKVTIEKDGGTHTLKIISTIEGSETGSERTFVY